MAINVTIGESKDKCYIYKIVSPSNKIYIGSTIDFNRRMRQYETLRMSKQTKLYNSFKKHGFVSHKIEIIDTCNVLDRNIVERKYCEKFNVLGDSGLNCAIPKVGDKTCMSVETKRKISIANTKRKLSIETKDKIRNANIGRKASHITIDKMKQSHLKRDKSIYIEIGAKLRGRKKSQEFKMKCSDRLYKKVIDTNSNKIYNSIKEAAMLNGIKYSTFVSRLKYKKNYNFKIYEPITLQNA